MRLVFCRGAFDFIQLEWNIFDYGEKESLMRGETLLITQLLVYQSINFYAKIHYSLVLYIFNGFFEAEKEGVAHLFEDSNGVDFADSPRLRFIYRDYFEGISLD